MWEHLHTIIVLTDKEAFLIHFQIKFHQCGIFSPFFLFFFNHRFRLLPTSFLCLKLPFSRQPRVEQCCLAWGWELHWEGAAPKGGHMVAAAMPLAADDQRSSANSRQVEEAEYIPRPSGDLNHA